MLIATTKPIRSEKEPALEILPERLAWFIAGPIIGLLTVALYAVANKHLGVTTSYLQVMTFVRSPRRRRYGASGSSAGSRSARCWRPSFAVVRRRT